ncbi:MAG: sigma-70 family RNA polymerase sigma factor [Betaproteobacteria bacterium]|nr:sigma-70 family RNA polymerase sigma factor [Betaproteobacteria bacterium]
MVREAENARAALAACLYRVAAQDRPALALLYRLTSAKLFGLCLRILNDRASAEDVLQEVYLAVWNKATQFDGGLGTSPMSWLLSITRNRALDRLRATRRTFAPLETAEEMADAAPLADAALETSEATRRLAACLDGLERGAAAAIRAAFFGGQTYESLARAAAMPLGSMKSLIRRGLQRLKLCLET